MQNLDQFPKIRNVDWYGFVELAGKLAEKVPTDLQKLPILTIGRGGVLLSGLLQYKFDNANNQIIPVTSYEGIGKQAETVKITNPPQVCYSEMLLIDDLVDSGKSVQAVLDFYPNTTFHVITIFRKKSAPVFHNHSYCAEIPDHIWVEFPWEVGTNANTN